MEAAPKPRAPRATSCGVGGELVDEQSGQQQTETCEHYGDQSAFSEAPHPPFDGEGEIRRTARGVEAFEARGALGDDKQNPYRDEHQAREEVGRVQAERAKRDLTPLSQRRRPRSRRSQRRAMMKRGGHAGVRGEEACTPQGRARCHGDGEYSAEDGSRAEAREPVDGAEREGCDQGATFDTTPQAFDRPEHEPAPNLDHTEGDYDEARDGDEGAPVPVDERADRGDAHPERHERGAEPDVEDGRPPHEIATRLEGVGEEGGQEQRAARAE